VNFDWAKKHLPCRCWIADKAGKILGGLGYYFFFAAFLAGFFAAFLAVAIFNLLF